MQSIITILGPTAIGKSSLAIELASEFDGAIISADSKQVYKGFDIGSGKIKPTETKGVPHYMLDICQLWEDYNLAKFQQDVKTILHELDGQKTLPFLVGGTGLYIESIIYNYQLPNTPIQPELRQSLSLLDKTELQNKLLTINPKIKLNQSDWNNPIRLIRAIEITKSKAIAKPKSESNLYKPLIIGLYSTLEEIKSRIINRVDARLKAGAILEVENIKNILNHKLKPDEAIRKLTQFGLGTVAINEYLEAKINYEEMRQKYIQSEYRYARRQLTWFRRMSKIHWFEANDKNLIDKTNHLISDFLQE